MLGTLKKYILLTFTIILILPPISISAGLRKPLPPLTISITPAQSGTDSDGIKPGEEVSLTIIAVSAHDVSDMQIEVQLLGGAKLISGSTSWRGNVLKNEQKTISLTVQAPETGMGKVRARVSLPPSNGTRLSTETEFILGPDVKDSTKPRPSLKKDGSGRNIREYR